ncbi:MAG: hypothetical protein WCA46_24345 [Actinocatenispora sp.]
MINLEDEIRRFVRFRYQTIFDQVHARYARRPVPVVKQAILDELRRAGTTPRMELVDQAAAFISDGGRFELP